MQLKTTMRYHLTLIRMITIKNTEKNKCWREWGELGDPHAVGGNVNGAAAMKNCMYVPQKIKNRTPI